MFEPLPRSFYEPSADVVAPRLLGHYLVRNHAAGLCGGLIIETEAYLMHDPACHGFIGKTPRNQALYGPPGHAYVYLIYGMHFCFNAVCCPEGNAEAVLVRAIEVDFGLDQILERRGAQKSSLLTGGPARLAEALDIDRALDGIDLCDRHSPILIGRNPNHKECLLERGPMITTTRIGITKAAALPLRFYLAGSRFVSRRAALDSSRQRKRPGIPSGKA